jgi:hypothetical protein
MGPILMAVWGGRPSPAGDARRAVARGHRASPGATGS